MAAVVGARGSDGVISQNFQKQLVIPSKIVCPDDNEVVDSDSSCSRPSSTDDHSAVDSVSRSDWEKVILAVETCRNCRCTLVIA